jgi:hypothetical protein
VQQEQQDMQVLQVLQEQVELLVLLVLLAQEYKEGPDMVHTHLHIIDLGKVNERVDVSLIAFIINIFIKVKS